MSLLRRTLLLAVGTLLVGGWAYYRLELSYDLASFLPAPTDDTQRVLTERLGQGPGARLVFVVLPDSDPDEASRLARELRALPLFERVLPEDIEISLASIPGAIWRNRLLLADLPTTEKEWLSILESRLDDMIFADDEEELRLISADPDLISLRTLVNYTSSVSHPVFQGDGEQFLIVYTSAPAFDISGQAEAVRSLRDSLQNFPAAKLYGSGVYGVDLQAAVQRESTLFSLIASIALAMLIAWRFRSATKLIAVGLPLLAGGSSGILVLTLIYPQIHGITLAFGFTLLGVALDYPLHIFTHAALRGSVLHDTVWPTLRIGIASTLIAYGTFLLSGATGLQQLGVLTITGIVVAALSAAWISQISSSAGPFLREHDIPQKLRHWPWVCVILATVPILVMLPLFNDDLGELMPIDKQTLQADAALRQKMGVADLRYLAAVRSPTLEETLRVTESVLERLDEAQSTGALAGAQSAVQILPSRSQQSVRRERMRELVNNGAFQRAVESLPYATDAFKPFTDALQVELARTDWLDLNDYLAERDIATSLHNLLYESEGQWVSLLFLIGIVDLESVAEQISMVPGVSVIDLKQTSMAMVADYRERMLRLLSAALVLITLMLWFNRKLNQVIWLMGSVTASVAVSALSSWLIQSSLSLFDLMALILVAGLGLDYALFYSRTGTKADAQATKRAIFVCAASSGLVFGILSMSSIPVLAGIGTTVAIGVLVAYLLARFGRYETDPV